MMTEVFDREIITLSTFNCSVTFWPVSSEGVALMGNDLPRFGDFVPELLSAAENVYKRCPFDEFEMSKVFVYLIGDLLASVEPEDLCYTDGGRELGIDFFVQDGQSYHIYQCKSVDLEKKDSAIRPPTFNAEDVNQLIRGVDFMRDKNNPFKSAKAEVRELRTRYQRDLEENPQDTQLYATLVVLGELTTGGLERFESKKEELAKVGVTLRLVTWADIYNALHVLDPIPLKGMKMSLRVDDTATDILHQKDWILGLVYVRDLIDAYEKYGVRLFDMNVRNEIKGSRINRAIVESLKTARGRKSFHHLNNGLLVVCTNYVLPKRPDDAVVLHEPQVINGCQTVTSLWRAYKDLVPADQKDLLDKVKVQVKVIQHMSQELIDEVVITTNNQNPMKPRNLRSNGREQRDIQRSFRSLPQSKWFYVRKDGEFESISQRGHQVQWFSKSDYEIKNGAGRRRYRVLDNTDVAKAWYSFIGFSGDAMMRGVDYFGNENTYQRVFTMRPSTQYWRQFRDPVFEKPSDNLFEPLSPTAHQFLLACAIDTYIRSRNPSPQQNRKDSIERLVKQRMLKGNPETGDTTASREEIAKALAGDQTYLRTMYLYNMENVLTELAAFLLVQRFGALTPDVALALLRKPDLQAWCAQGFSSLNDDHSVYTSDDAVLPRLYGFLSWAIGKNYFANEQYEIEASSRPKAYLARRPSIIEMRRVLLRSNQISVDISDEWKKQSGISFLDSLR